MTFLATQPVEERQALQALQQTPGDPDAFKPGFFEGMGGALVAGGGRVVATANQLAGEVEFAGLSVLTKPVDALFDTKFTQALDFHFRQAPRHLTASMTPDPYTTGTAAQVLYGLVGIGVPAAAGFVAAGPLGAAATAGGFSGLGTYADLTVQGVDPVTAGGAAAFDAVLAGVGVGLPAAIGGRIALNTLLYGPGINVAQNLVQGQGTAAWLEARGYDELADRYAEIDAEMLAADAVLGAAFGWAGARSVSRGTVATVAGVDTAHAALDQRHVELDTAPGIPANMAALQEHTRQLQAATEAVLDGRRPEPSPLAGRYAPKPANPAYADDQLVQALRESGYPELVAEVGALEAELAARGRVVDDAPLPDLPMPPAGRFEASLNDTARPGERMLVVRLASPGRESLANSNAANIDGATYLLSKQDDMESSVGVPDDAVLTVWETTVPEGGLGNYQPIMQERPRGMGEIVDEGHVGRGRAMRADDDSVWYSFGAKAGAGARKVASVSLAQIRADKKQALGDHLFSYSVQDADWLRSYVGEKIAAASAEVVAPRIPRDAKLPGQEAEIEGRFADEIARDVPAAIDRYAALPETEGGKVLNTDLARELSADYRADRTRSAAVHEPASWLVKEMYRRKLREAPAAGERAKVLFTGGGTGAGKSTAIENIPAAARAKAQSQIVYDTNLNGVESSVTKIEQALRAEKAVQIMFVLRDPVEALVKGALPRAERMGRTVPLSEHAKTHAGSARTLQKLAERYADDDRVTITVIDNTHGKGKAKLSDIALAATFDYSDLAKRLRAALDKEYESGTVSEAVYRGTAGEDAASAGLRRAVDPAGGRAGAVAADDGSQAAQRDGGRGVGPESERADSAAAGLTRIATAVVTDTPDLPVAGETGLSMPAAAALSDADRAVAFAEQDAPGFHAAIDCFLRRGV